MAAGLWLYAAGQSTLAYFQLIRHQAISFPSPADIFFLSGVVVIAAALGSFLIDLTRSGFPIELRDQMPRTVAIVLGAGGLVSWTMFRPLLPLQDLDVKTVLTLLYPIKDVFLLVPVVLLQQATRRFRGGGISRVWTTMLAGFALLLLGDLSFALILESSVPALAAVVDGCYLVGYALVTRACLLQLEMLD